MPRFKVALFELLVLVVPLFAAAPAAAAERSVDATKAGVVGDGATLNTAAIQKAIDTCAASGGCTLRFPAGRYLTGTIEIKSNVRLRLEEGATLLGSTDAADYRNLDPFIDGVTIRSRGLGMPNNDGINIDSSENVRVRGCDVVSGDDALVIKSTSRARPSRDIVATDCKLSTRTNAIKLGTESIGGFENIRVSNVRITKTQMAGIALYEVDGGELRNVEISDVTMDGVIVPISIRLGARLKTFREGDQPRPAAGHLRDIVIKNVSAKNIEMIGILINGVPGHPVEALTLENIQLELPGGGTAEMAKVELPEKEAAYPEFDTFGKTMPAHAFYARHVRGLKLRNVRASVLKPDARPATVFIDVEDVTPADFATQSPRPM